jgi:RNA polymerase sigma factor (sigma-70 family)
MAALLARADRETAGDLCQEVFLKLVEDDARRLRAFNAALGVPFPAYLRVITVRLHIDWLRGREHACAQRTVSFEGLESSPSTSPVAGERLAAREVREAVEALPPHQRLALELTLEGMTVKEVARTLALTEGGAAALLWRARQGLKASLAGGWGDPTPV